VVLGLFSLGFPILMTQGMGSDAGWTIYGGGGVLFFGLAVLTGWCVGGVFPAAWQMGVAAGLRKSGSTAVWDALDHVGAAGGSLLTGVILIPVLGIEGTALILQALVGLGLLLVVPLLGGCAPARGSI
jgi:hypothetical protein